jgi:copper chaperone CopZ
METKFTVPEISCGHCKDTIETAINTIESVKKVSVNIDEKLVEISSTNTIDMEFVTNLLDEQGYTVVESN